jgi:hypothetical protein
MAEFAASLIGYPIDPIILGEPVHRHRDQGIHGGVDSLRG